MDQVQDTLTTAEFEAADFAADLDYLYSLAAQILEHAGDNFNPPHPCVEARLITDLSCEALRAINTHGWSFQDAWDAA